MTPLGVFFRGGTMIKLVTIDLDGTLFDNQKRISDKNKIAIKKAKELGCHVVIATGRPLNGVLPVLKELDLLDDTDYCIIYNGAKIFNVKTKELVFSSSITGLDVKDLYHEALRLNTYLQAFCIDETLITKEHNPYTDIEASLNHIKDELYDFDTIKDNDLFLKFMMVNNEETLNRVIKEINPLFKEKYSMVRSSPIFLEFLNKNTNKGNALVALANYLNIPIEDTMAIGDQDNDISMIKASGFGVCMANGVDEAKCAADFITLDNESSGVAYAFEKFILEQK